MQSKFDIEERAKKWVLGSIFSSWRNHKCRLKAKYFFPNMRNDYNIKNCPLSIPLDQWKILVKFWKSEIAKVILLFIFYYMIICTYTLVDFYLYSFHDFIIKVCSENNKTSRAKFIIVHTTKTKIRYEEFRPIA